MSTKVLALKKNFRSVSLSQIIAPIALVALLIIFTIASPGFLLEENVMNLLKQSSINLVIATGMTVVILTGGIDLSAGSVVALAMCTMGVASKTYDMNIWVAAALGVSVAIFCGLINGLLICYGKVPAFIATLGMQGIARGIALIITGGYPFLGFDASFRWMATGTVCGIPFMFLLAFVILMAGAYMLKYTELGRSFYAIGGNEEAARYSGIKVYKVRIIAHMVIGLCCGIAAMVLAARLNSATPAAGENYQLDAIAAVVIGGTSQKGGEGTIIGSLVGVLVIATLNNGLQRLNVDSFVQTALIGLVIVAAVLVQTVGSKDQ